MSPPPADIVPITAVSDRHFDAAVNLLARFFREEGFLTPRRKIAEHLDRMITDAACWIAVAVGQGLPTGIITVTTMLYVESGRVAEIGDLYVAPAYRGQSLARQLVNAAIEWSRQQDCSGVYVTVTPDGEARHRLSKFYARLSFRPTGRTTMMLAEPG